MLNLWICEECKSLGPCYVVSNGENNPCGPCGRAKLEHIKKARNVKLIYDIEEVQRKEIK